MKKTITYKQAEELSSQAHNYLFKNGVLSFNKETNSLESTDTKPTKLSQGLKNIIKQVSKLSEEIIAESNELLWKNALVDDKTKRLIMEADNKTYAFTADGRIKYQADIKALKEKEVDIHIRLQEEESVDLEEYDMFNGIVVPEVVNA